jgi:hypothetical protein
MVGMRFALLFSLTLLALGQADTPDRFAPTHRVSGIGLDRDDLSAELLAIRSDRMVDSQTFAILRDPQAVPGAKRITSDFKLHGLFHNAARDSGFPEPLLEAISYLESWGDPNAPQSPTGPVGIMQVSEGTARIMGLKVVHSTRYRVSREKVPVASKGRKPKFKTVTHKTPYTVISRDDRLVPARVIPAAAKYLAGMEQKFGGQDWAIFAYHCGQGCVAEMQELTRRARGIPRSEITVPRMFFSCSPAWNRELYQAISQQMQRDYSPTYYFRILRAAQLLDLYRRDRKAFLTMAQTYKSEFASGPRAPHRLSVWLRREDLVYRSLPDIRTGKTLAQALDNPQRYGYSLQLAPADSAAALPAALGTLAYVSYETRRLFDEYKPRGEHFQPLPVTSLVKPEDSAQPASLHEALAHASGQVFDIDYSGLPPGELECLRFVLDDLGWDGYIGFVDEGRDNLHIGCAPAAREFFTSVFQEALETAPGR